jgi:hypothetical protein
MQWPGLNQEYYEKLTDRYMRRVEKMGWECEDRLDDVEPSYRQQERSEKWSARNE